MSNNFINKYSEDVKELQLTRIPFGIYTDGKHKFVYFKRDEQELSIGSLDLHAFNW